MPLCGSACRVAMSLTGTLYDSGLFSEVLVEGEGLAQTLSIRKALGAGKVARKCPAQTSSSPLLSWLMRPALRPPPNGSSD